MTLGAGVVRSAGSLAEAAEVVDGLRSATAGMTPGNRTEGELANLVTVARCVLDSATLRTESRGSHARSDYPATEPDWRRRIVHADDSVEVMDGPVGVGGGSVS